MKKKLTVSYLYGEKNTLTTRLLAVHLRNVENFAMQFLNCKS